MGTKTRSFALLPREVSLEELVPKDHFYRRLEATLDLSFVRELVRPLYAGGGRPSVDPVVFFKLQLVMFFEDLRSERQLMRMVGDRLSLRWYVGYDLHEPLPDHSSLTRIRERYGLAVFRRFFERIVELCFEAGLVKGDELFFDSTTVKADAARNSLVPRLSVVRHIEELFEDSPVEEPALTPEPPRADVVLPTAEDPELKAANEARDDFVSSVGRRGSPARVPNPHPKRSGDVVSRTDPDARLAGHIKASAKMGYKAHYVVDGGKARVIMNALVTRADLQDNQPMLDLLWRTAFRWRIRPHHVTADGKYGTVENIKAVEHSGIRAYLALHEAGGGWASSARAPSPTMPRRISTSARPERP